MGMSTLETLLALYLFGGAVMGTVAMPGFVENTQENMNNLDADLTRAGRIFFWLVAGLTGVAFCMLWPFTLTARLALQHPEWLSKGHDGPQRRLCGECFLVENPSDAARASLPELSRKRTRCHACKALGDCVAVVSCDG